MRDNFDLYQNLETERAVLGSLIYLGSKKDMDLDDLILSLKDNMFSIIFHRVVFNALAQLNRKSEAIDLITVSDIIKNDPSYAEKGGFANLSDLMKNGTPSSSQCRAYIKIILDHSAKVRVYNLANDMLKTVNENEINTDEIINNASKEMESIIDNKDNDEDDFEMVGDYLPKYMDMLQARFDGTESGGFLTNIPSLDNLIGGNGFRKGSLVVIAGRPKMGKTAFARQLMTSADNPDYQQLFFSMEMDKSQITELLLSSHSGVSPQFFHGKPDPRLSNDEAWARIGDAVGWLEGIKLNMNDKPTVSSSYVRKWAKREHKKKPISFIYIDYLTLMEQEKAERNDLSIGNVVKELRAIAKELNCVVVLLAQLNRGLENRPDKRPVPSDTRESGQIEQDAAYWFGVYRESVYNEDVPPHDRGKTELLLRLNRFGETGTCHVDLVNGSFVECEPFDGLAVDEEDYT